MRSKSSSSFFRKTRFVNTVAIGYLFLAIVAVILEFFQDKELLILVKPIVIPTLVFLYWCSTRRINLLFIFALVAVWLANLFSTSTLLIPMVIGTLFVLIYKVFYVHLIHTSIKIKAFFPVVVSSVPFVLFYILLTIITYSSIQDLFFLYLTQSIIFIILGSYALANFFSKSRKSSLYLLMAVLFLMIDQVLGFILKGNFEAVGLLFFYAAHYLFSCFLVVDEKRRRHHDSFKIQITERNK
jgi:hypothetical protein